MKLQKEFHLALFRAFMYRAQPDQVAMTLSCLGEGDFPKRELLTILEDTLPPLENTNIHQEDWNSPCPNCNLIECYDFVEGIRSNSTLKILKSDKSESFSVQKNGKM